VTLKEYNFVMKILIYDNNPADLGKLCNMLEALPMKFFIDKISHYNDCIEFYNRYHYDMVFLDFIDDIGKKILNYILEKNPKQRIITISDVDVCSEKNGCDFCTSTYNKKRVTKPVKENDLFTIFLKEEPCHSYCNLDLLLKLEIISKNIQTLSFDKERFAFVRNSQNYHREMSEIIHLSYTLSEENIHFQLMDDGIQILPVTYA